MKEYTVRPEKMGEKANQWYVKIEDTGPTSAFDSIEDAIEEGQKLAEENKPSRLVVYNHMQEKVDEKVFK